MIKLGKTKCNRARNEKCLSCQRKFATSSSHDFKLHDDDLDLIVGGMSPNDLRKVMSLAATDMNLDALTPTSYFQE